MRSQAVICFLTSIIAHAAATGVLLPLYVYPSAVFNDGAALWQPVITAMKAHTNVPWLAVINPGSGPGAGQPGNGDTNYISGVSQLNGLHNVRTVGYVHTSDATAPMAELQANITTWKNWDTLTTSNVSVGGIFFDEASTSNFAYLSQATAFARQAFGTKPITVICNFGVSTPAEFYSICDVVIAFESCLNCVDPATGQQNPQYESQTTISANIPSGKQSQAAILVHDFTGNAQSGATANAALLQQYVDTIVADGVGWTYFCSAGYDSVTTSPATPGVLAADIASA